MRRLAIWTLAILCLAPASPVWADDHKLQAGGLTATVADEFAIDSGPVSHLDVVVANNSPQAYKHINIAIGVYNHAGCLIETNKNASQHLSGHDSWVFTITVTTSSSSIGKYRILSLNGTH